MCLDVKLMHINQSNMKTVENTEVNRVKPEEFQSRCLCGGSLIEQCPVFDPKGE